MIRQTPYNKNNESKNNSEHSANRALPPSGEPEGASGASFISHSLSLPLQSVSAVLTLLDEGCTIPFISRYRKERTGGLDEVQITDISELYDRLKELGKRKETILKTIREQEKLTPELEARIHACMDSTELEDIYLPYKPKRRTRAQIAREQGLGAVSVGDNGGSPKNDSPTRPPRRGRRQTCKYSAEISRKSQRIFILSCAHRHSSPFGEVGWGSSPPFGGVGGGFGFGHHCRACFREPASTQFRPHSLPAGGYHHIEGHQEDEGYRRGAEVR